jgi:hypothetical protein
MFFPSSRTVPAKTQNPHKFCAFRCVASSHPKPEPLFYALYNTTMDPRYVQFGCGMCAPETWQNFDAGPAFWIQSRLPVLTPLLVKRGFPPYPKNILYGDVIKGLPIAPQSAEAVYCSHVLEHMTLDEFRLAIRRNFSHGAARPRAAH